MPGVNLRLSSSSSSSFSSSSSSQLSTPRTLESGFLQNPLEKRSPKAVSSLCWDSEKANSEKYTLPSNTLTPKSSAELRKEIVMLESQILRLERRLLSLYRTAFDEHVPSLSNVSRRNSQNRSDSYKQKGGFVYHYQVSDWPSFSSSLEASSARDMKRTESGHCSLADLLGVSHMLENHDTPNRLSEEMLRYISSIYCKLSACGSSNSTPSLVSSSSLCSKHSLVNRNSEKTGEDNSSDVTVVDILKLSLDEDNFKCVDTMLRNYRSLVYNLEKVDPRYMAREEKLAFWINIHNALLMHAYLAYGTRGRAGNSSVLKAAYNIGGRCVNAYDIQRSILSIQPHLSASRLQTLFSPGRKSRTGCSKHIYALDYPEPLVHFALCSGASAEPMVRVYTAKSIFQDLGQAKDEFVRANVLIENQTKILLPKILYYYSKDASLDIAGLVENAMRKCMKVRHQKHIHWLSQVSDFRFVIHPELVTGRREI